MIDTYTPIIRSKTYESTQVLNAPILNIFLKFFFLKKLEGLSTELFRQSNYQSCWMSVLPVLVFSALVINSQISKYNFGNLIIICRDKMYLSFLITFERINTSQILRNSSKALQEIYAYSLIFPLC